MPSHTLDHLENPIVDRQDAVPLVTVNRPCALSSQTLDELRRANLPFLHDADVRTVVVTGAGERRSWQ